MIWQLARVVDRDADRLTLAFSAPETCERCARGAGCGAGVLNRMFTRHESRLVVPARLAVSAGEHVRVGLEPGHLALAAGLHYGLPLAAFLVGAAAGHTAVAGSPLRDAAALAFGFVGFILVARFVSRRLQPTLNPVVEHLSCSPDDTNSFSSE
ncbi:SoxR reducing system RseC family protein [Wenzhouxiangella sp. EGI_FJ10305]|uniref:SoxR reducing system RseC family protein n=1 Tax=Wenzhouxiangella sp. EGI_FJ10305 TaxID=3243768 RepID=UPI0035D555FA